MDHDIDLHRVLIEIDEEVRAKRASGELPHELERELDLVFARLAPAGAVEGDFDQLLERAESHAFFDLIAPNESARPGVPYIKRIVQKSVRWYMRYVIEQVTGFAHTITKATRQLGNRVDVLEQLIAPTDETQAIGELYTTLNVWQTRIIESLKGVSGRVLHARCGTGELVKQLCSAGIDAYGVDPASDLISIGTADSTGLDIRPDDERAHLRILAPGVLSGLVLTGSVEILSRGAQVEMVSLAATVLARGGVLVIATANPDAWENSRSPIQVDLAQGRPMHAETWKYLLVQHGFEQVIIDHALVNEKLVHSQQESMETKANIDKLNSILFPPESSLLIARR